MIGVLTIGSGGATASTLIAGSLAMGKGSVESTYGITSQEPFKSLPLIDPSQITWGGWEITERRTLADAIRSHGILTDRAISEAPWIQEALPFMEGVCLPTDFLVEHDGVPATDNSREDATLRLRHDIQTFRRSNTCSQCIVINLSNPPKANSPSSASIYLDAALAEGCHFIEFTPSPTLDSPSIWQSAADAGVQVAGRDGSTGQTALKVLLAHFFNLRGFDIESWYSTNLLGNHDGLVLSHSAWAEHKLKDKLEALDPYVEQGDPDHIVRIEYIPDRGDSKEAWDSVRLRGWMNSQHSLAMHWLGQDSYLAAPLILDLIRLVEYGKRTGKVEPGLQPQLGVFFKRPLGSQGTSWWNLYGQLLEIYASDSAAPGENISV